MLSDLSFLLFVYATLCLALIKSVYKKIFYPIFVFFALNICKYALPEIEPYFLTVLKKPLQSNAEAFSFIPLPP